MKKILLIITLLSLALFTACRSTKTVEKHSITKDSISSTTTNNVVKDSAVAIAKQEVNVVVPLKFDLTKPKPTIKDTLITTTNGKATATIYIHDNKITANFQTAAYDLIIQNLRRQNTILKVAITTNKNDSVVTTCRLAHVRWYHITALWISGLSILTLAGYVFYRIYLKRG
jgi:hypothetical protein